MFLHEFELKNFRCFEQKTLKFQKPITFISGINGIGKTSILEAIHYLCYFKSFRSHMISDVMSSGSDSFFVKGSFDKVYDLDTTMHSIQVGYAGHKKIIKLDQKTITSYKEIMSFFQVITLTEDDIDLIKGYPGQRRSFIDQAVLLSDPHNLDFYNTFKKVLAHRNSLFMGYKDIDLLELDIWNQALWNATVQIQKLRIQALEKIILEVNALLDQYFEGIYNINIVYDPKYANPDEDYATFSGKLSSLLRQEKALKRSMFGAHLDDLHIQIMDKKAKVFASRGQQKLISLLCKLSLIHFTQNKQNAPILLIDDFISDFDKIRLKQLVFFFQKCQNQIIITAPFYDVELKELFKYSDLELISL